MNSAYRDSMAMPMAVYVLIGGELHLPLDLVRKGRLANGFGRCDMGCTAEPTA